MSVNYVDLCSKHFPHFIEQVSRQKTIIEALFRQYNIFDLLPKTITTLEEITKLVNNQSIDYGPIDYLSMELKPCKMPTINSKGRAFETYIEYKDNDQLALIRRWSDVDDNFFDCEDLPKNHGKTFSSVFRRLAELDLFNKNGFYLDNKFFLSEIQKDFSDLVDVDWIIVDK